VFDESPLKEILMEDSMRSIYDEAHNRREEQSVDLLDLSIQALTHIRCLKPPNKSQHQEDTNERSMAANPDRKTGTPRLRRTTENTLRRK
jgi:hypothetical protein